MKRIVMLVLASAVGVQAATLTLRNDSKKSILMTDAQGHTVQVLPGKENRIDLTRPMRSKLWPVHHACKCEIFVQGITKNSFNKQYVLTQRQWPENTPNITFKFSDIERRGKELNDFFKVSENLPEWLY